MRAGVEWLGAQGLRAIGLLGHSKGGSAVVLYAAKYDDVPRVVNVSGRFDMKRGARPQLPGLRSACVEFHDMQKYSRPGGGARLRDCRPRRCSVQVPAAMPALERALSAQSAAPKRVLSCAAGVKERFGQDVLERLEREGSVPMEWRGGRGRQPFRWTLTKQARLILI